MNPEKFEILPAVATITGMARKLVVVAAYIPPNYPAAWGAACLDFLDLLVLDIKRKYRNPLVVIAGDFNQWPVQEAVQEYPDLSEIHVGPTRGDRAIDRLFTNMSRNVVTSGSVPPPRD